MKKVFLPIFFASTLLVANNENYIELGAGVVKSIDNFSTDSKKTITSLNTAKSEKETTAYISFFLGYKINRNLNIYLNSELGNLNLGSNLDTDIGTFDFGIKLNGLLGQDEWKNPYLLKKDREKTSTKELGAYIGYSIPFSQSHILGVQYTYGKKEYDKEELKGNLRREGNRHILNIGDTYFSEIQNTPVGLITNLTFEKYNAKGKVNSFKSYRVEMGPNFQFNNILDFTLLGHIGNKDYEEKNPILNKKIEVKTYGVIGVLKWKKPMDFENTYISLTTGYDKENANHNFYDKKDAFSILSVGYEF